MSKIILDLCGGTGSWSKPYRDAGYDVRVITLPHKRPPFEVQHNPVVTLRTEQLVDINELHALSATDEYGLSYINKMLASQLLHQILNYANIETMNNPYGYYGKELIQATIKIVDMSSGKGNHDDR